MGVKFVLRIEVQVLAELQRPEETGKDDPPSCELQSLTTVFFFFFPISVLLFFSLFRAAIIWHSGYLNVHLFAALEVEVGFFFNPGCGGCRGGAGRWAELVDAVMIAALLALVLLLMATAVYVLVALGSLVIIFPTQSSVAESF